ncbi:MAG: alpha/beta hydrolase [Balneolaceae bacterium]|nr:alpha/beta hydrolase [Balneolaceae bacterium]
MHKALFIVLGFALSLSLHAQSPISTQNKTPLTIGESVTIHSDILDEDRILNVYLPFGYTQNTDKEYPVIYLLDGSIYEDFIHISGLVQFGSFSWINMIPETIVVGISNVDRKRDFTYPSNNELDNKELPTSGGSKKFISFIEQELQPYVDASYRTTSAKTIIGQSLGGLLATEILFKNPMLFDHYLIVSPSLWWDDESLLEFTPADYTVEKSIYVAVGKEGEVMERIAQELYDKLQTLQNDNTDIYFNFLEEQDHGDALHLAVYDAFEKVFGKNRN